MAFNAANLVPLYNLADLDRLPIVWEYTTGDNKAAITTSYFDPAYLELRNGDLIQITASDGKILVQAYDVVIFGSTNVTIGFVVADVNTF